MGWDGMKNLITTQQKRDDYGVRKWSERDALVGGKGPAGLSHPFVLRV